MNNPRIALALGYIDDRFIEESISYAPHNKKNGLLKYTGIAACGIIVFAVVIILRFGLVGHHATDVYRQGNCFKVNDQRTLSEISEKPLLAERLDLSDAYYSDIELWYNESGSTSDLDAWYSLITSGKFDEYEFVLYSLFEGDIDNWKVKTVFTEENTRAIDMNGVTVLTAPHPISVDYPYYDYALFEYEGIIYDLRVQSNSKSTMLNLLNEIIPNLDNE